MLSESLHPNRLVAGSFASPSRDLLQIGFRLYPLPNNAITGKAGDIGFIQRNGWFGRSYRQTVKLSDFVSHPQIRIKGIFRYISVYADFLIFISLSYDSTRTLLQVGRTPRDIEVMKCNQLVLHIRSGSHLLSRTKQNPH